MKLNAIAAVIPAFLQLTAVTGNNYNEEWTVKLQAGLTYHSIELETNLVNPLTIKKITIDKNGTPIAYASNKYLDMLDKAYQKHQAQGRYVFDLSKFQYRSPAGIYQTQLVTTLTDDVTIKIEFGAKDAADPAIPTLKAKGYVTDTVDVAYFEPRRYELMQQSAAAGEHVWNFPSGSVNKKIQTIVFEENNVAISQVEIKRKGKTLRKFTRSDIDYALQRHAGVSLQAGYLIFDFTLFGFGTHGMPTHDLEFHLTVDGAGAIKTYVDGYEQVRFPQQAVA